MEDILIINGHIIDPASKFDGIANVLVRDGNVERIGDDVFSDSAETIDAEGLVVCPGFVDLHCHLRQPGQEYKETIATGTLAAAHGGFTTVCAMPNTLPPLDNRIMATYTMDMIRKDAAIRVLLVGCISRGRRGEELADMAELAGCGVVGFSDDGAPVASARIMRRAMDYSIPLNVPIMEHCEERELSENTYMNEGIIATRLGLAGAPAAAEDIAVSRNIRLAELTGAHLHVTHVSTSGAVELIRAAKTKRAHITAEVTPHHLTLSEERVMMYDTRCKVNPPLRTLNDIEALIEGLLDGTIDAIATDHAPHSATDKECEFAVAAAGISGFETAFGSLMKLVHAGRLPLSLLISKLTFGPAQVLGNKWSTLGRLVPGGPADIVLLSPDRKWQVDTGKFVSRGKNTPLHGENLQGMVMLTMCDGKIIYRNEGTGIC